MDIYKVTAADLRKVESKQLREEENGLRRKIQEARFGQFLGAEAKSSQLKALKKSLARLLTVDSERRRENESRGS